MTTQPHGLCLCQEARYFTMALANASAANPWVGIRSTKIGWRDIARSSSFVMDKKELATGDQMSTNFSQKPLLLHSPLSKVYTRMLSKSGILLRGTQFPPFLALTQAMSSLRVNSVGSSSLAPAPALAEGAAATVDEATGVSTEAAEEDAAGVLTAEETGAAEEATGVSAAADVAAAAEVAAADVAAAEVAAALEATAGLDEAGAAVALEAEAESSEVAPPAELTEVVKSPLST